MNTIEHKATLGVWRGYAWGGRRAESASEAAAVLDRAEIVFDDVMRSGPFQFTSASDIARLAPRTGAEVVAERASTASEHMSPPFWMPLDARTWTVAAPAPAFTWSGQAPSRWFEVPRAPAAFAATPYATVEIAEPGTTLQAFSYVTEMTTFARVLEPLTGVVSPISEIVKGYTLPFAHLSGFSVELPLAQLAHTTPLLGVIGQTLGMYGLTHALVGRTFSIASPAYVWSAPSANETAQTHPTDADEYLRASEREVEAAYDAIDALYERGPIDDAEMSRALDVLQAALGHEAAAARVVLRRRMGSLDRTASVAQRADELIARYDPDAA